MKYVRFLGKYYVDTGLRDYRGYADLVSITDSSCGILADPKLIKIAEEDQIDGIGYFLRKAADDNNT